MLTGRPLRAPDTVRRPRSEPTTEAAALAEALPELADWLVAALDQTGRADLAATASGMPAWACWPGALGNFTLGAVLRGERTGLFHHASREMLRVAPPHGLARRRWQVGVTAVGGEVKEIGVVRPGTLRPALQRLSRALVPAEKGRR